MSTDIAKKAISGVIWMSGISYIGFAINFAIQLILVRLLIPEDFGLFALGLSVAEILFIFFSFSFSMGVIQIQEAEDLFDTAFYLSLTSGIIILIFGGIISFFISNYYPLKSVVAFFILCALQPLQGCSSIYSASMEKELLFKKNALVRGMATNFSGFGAILLAYLGYGVWSLVGREVISALLMLFGMRYFSYYRFKGRFNKNTARKLIEFGYKMLLSRGVEIVYHRFPNFLIGTFIGTKPLGFFSQTYYLASLPNALLTPVTTYVAFPTYSKIAKDKEKIGKAFFLTNYFFIRFLVPLMLILFLFPTEVLSILYGRKWIEASSMLRFFSVYAICLPLFSNAKTFLYSMGELLNVSKTYSYAIVIIFIGTIMASYTKIASLVALFYSISILIGMSIIFYYLSRTVMALELNLKKLFVLPIVLVICILFSWQLFPLNLEVLFWKSRISTICSFLILYFLFLIAILFFELKTFISNIILLKKNA